MTVSALTAHTIALFEPPAQPLSQPSSAAQAADRDNAPDVESHIAQLKAAALQGSQEAIELLGNLAVAFLDPGVVDVDDPVSQSRQAAAEGATQALLAIFSQPDTPDDVRASIRQWSLQVFDTAAKAPVAPARDADDLHLSVHVPTPLLVLALRQTVVAGQNGSQDQVGQALHERLGEALEEAPRSLRSTERFVCADEILLPLQASGVPTLGLQDSPIRTADANFPVDLRAVADAVLQDGGLRSVVIHAGNHWIAAVIGPSTADQAKLQVVVYDSLHEPGSDAAHLLEEAVRRALGDDSLQGYTHAGGNVQRMTNGCGAFCVRALRELDGAIADQRVTSMDDVAAFLEADIDAMREWTDATLQDVAAGLRAEMLWHYEANSPVRC